MTKSKTFTLYELLAETCVGPELSSFLRNAQEKYGFRDIRITGKNEDLVTNIREAVERGFATEADVEELLQDAEENGNQYIFFYRVPDGPVKDLLNKYNEISKRILKNENLTEQELPQRTLIPDGIVLSDLRKLEKVSRKAWLIKYYGSYLHQKTLSKELDPKDSTITIKKIQTEQFRFICSVIWDGNRFLQVRIGRPGDTAGEISGQGRILKRLKEIWKRFKVVVREDKLVKVNFREAMQYYTSLEDPSSQGCNVSDETLCHPSHGSADFQSVKANDGRIASAGRKEAVQRLRQDGYTFDRMRINFHDPKSTEEKAQPDIPVVVGTISKDRKISDPVNDIGITKEISKVCVDHAISKLLPYAK